MGVAAWSNLAMWAFAKCAARSPAFRAWEDAREWDVSRKSVRSVRPITIAFVAAGPTYTSSARSAELFRRIYLLRVDVGPAVAPGIACTAVG